MKTALIELSKTAGAFLLAVVIVVVALFVRERIKNADIDFEVLGVRGTGGNGGAEYEVTLSNLSSERITIYTYIRTADGFEFCPTQHVLRANATTRDYVVCNAFRSINNERYQIFAVLRLPEALRRDLSRGHSSGRVVSFR